MCISDRKFELELNEIFTFFYSCIRRSMDGQAVISSLATFRSALRRNWQKVTVVSPYIWVSCYIPFVLFLTLAVWILFRNGIEGEIQCMPIEGFTQQHVHSTCLRESYSVMDL